MQGPINARRAAISVVEVPIRRAEGVIRGQEAVIGPKDGPIKR
jgi:hypothetical protein